MVELKDQLSRREIQTMMDETARVINGSGAALVLVGNANETAVQPGRPHRRWRLVDRLGEQVIHQLLADSRSGMSKPALVTRYGISRNSVKRLLRHQQSLSQVQGDVSHDATADR